MTVRTALLAIAVTCVILGGWFVVAYGPTFAEWKPLVQFVERLFAHPFMIFQILGLALVAWGGLGSGLGLSALFWPHNRWHQLFIGLAVGWVCGQVLFTVLILNYYTTAATGADPNAVVNLPILFHSEAWADTGLYPQRGTDIPKEVTTFSYSLLWTWVGAIALVLLPKVVSRPFRNAPTRHLPLLVGAALAPILTWLLYECLSRTAFYGGARDFVQGNAQLLIVTVRSCFAIVAFCVLGSVALHFNRTATGAIRWIGVAAPLVVWIAATLLVTLNYDQIDESRRQFVSRLDQYPLLWFAPTQSLLALIAVSAVLLVLLGQPTLRRAARSPVIVLCVLLVVFDGAYEFVWCFLLAPTGIGPTFAFVLLIGIVLWGVSTNSHPFKYSLPGLEGYYSEAARFYDERRRTAKEQIDEAKHAPSVPPVSEPGAKDASEITSVQRCERDDGMIGEHARPRAATNEAPLPTSEWLVRIDYDEENVDHLERLLGTPSAQPLLDSEKVLEAMYVRWRKNHTSDISNNNESRPRLVIVCSSGGGVLAAVWAAVVLEGLERELERNLPRNFEKKEGFPYHIRLLTGASGGMVGAALYAAEFIHDHNHLERDSDTGLGRVSKILAQDSLSPVVQTMLWHDLRSIWLPGQFTHDRGRRLEAVWDVFFSSAKRIGKGFQTAFDDLRPYEGMAECPSLVFSPMLVEDARRLLVSNLDLANLTTAHAHRLMPNVSTPQNELLSRSAIEFFRLFPKARNCFTLGTAARMNASFPFISPAVSLPTFPPRRVIDAGFYDNFGVGLAAQWLLRHEDAIKKFTSGVVLIESRAYRYGTTRRYFLDPEVEEELPEGRLDREQVKRRPRDPVAAAASWASSPLEALLNLRQRGAYYRNDELLQLLDERLNAGPDKSFFTTVGFECPVDAALSWAMPAEDACRVGQGFHMTDPHTGLPVLNPRVARQMKHLKNWFGNGGKVVT